MSRRSAAACVALLLTGVLWLSLHSVMLAQIEHGGPAPTRTPDTGPSPTPPPGATATRDRLAPPPTVAAPNQADEGAYLYWLHCLPCHGDVGQGLTDEWRAEYPPEEQNCWESGCHGPRPYDLDVALPTAVPAVIGDGALQKFETMDALYGYVSVAMPLFFPGDLSQEEYLAILAHLARENDVWDGRTLTLDNLDEYHLGPAQAAPTATPTPAATPAPPAFPNDGNTPLIGLGAAGALLLAGGIILWRKRAR